MKRSSALRLVLAAMFTALGILRQWHFIFFRRSRHLSVRHGFTPHAYSGAALRFYYRQPIWGLDRLYRSASGAVP